MLVLRRWTAALQLALPAKVPVPSSCICQSCCISEWFVLAFSITLLDSLHQFCSVPSVSKLLLLNCAFEQSTGEHILASSSFLSSDFFSLALYPQKGTALLWHSFSMTDRSALTSYLLSSLLDSWVSPFSFLVTYWGVRIYSLILLLV